MMKVIQSTHNDIDIIMHTIDFARQLMRENGNDVQWTNGYPSKALMLESISKGFNYLIIDEQDNVLATFDFIIGVDTTYHFIEDGSWLNDDIYGVIHRLATNGRAKGVAQFCFNWCFSQHPNIRLDTHESNVAMQIVLGRLGYEKCGTIYVNDGTARLAYQKI